MKYKSIIVEDMYIAAQSLEFILMDFEEITNLSIANGKWDAIEKINKLKPDIIFLDYHLGEDNGFEVLDNCIGNYRYVCMISAYKEYALKSYNYNTIHYILKPITKKCIQELLNKLNTFQSDIITPKLTNIKYDKNEKFIFAQDKSWKSIIISTIIYIEADGSYCNIITTNGQFRISKNLMYCRTNIKNFDILITVHRSYIINLNYIKEIKKNKNQLLMVNDFLVPYSLKGKSMIYSSMGI